jgi:hypothetical protein
VWEGRWAAEAVAFRMLAEPLVQVCSTASLREEFAPQSPAAVARDVAKSTMTSKSTSHLLAIHVVDAGSLQEIAVGLVDRCLNDCGMYGVHRAVPDVVAIRVVPICMRRGAVAQDTARIVEMA